MRRVTLAMTLSFGFAIVGCGETTPTADSPKAETASPAVTPEEKGGEDKAAAPAAVAPGGAAPGGAPRAKMAGGGPGGSTMLPGAPVAPYYIGPEGKPVSGTEGAKGKPVAAPDAKDGKPAEPKKDDKKDDKLKTADITLTAEEIAGIKKLPEADQAAALAQKICPVQEDEDGKPNHLGAMGKPFKKVVKGKTVYLCCGGCAEDLEKDPDKYLAKLAK
ncbi:MAG: hypothetical protein JWN86_1701 [Planctomycetota bacterium]|nr:hypothetical protein [Planctomycetota bacterium]